MTKRERSIFAGMTDYTGVPMDVILADLLDWQKKTAGCIKELKQLGHKVEENRDRLDSPREILGYIHHFVDLLTRYAGDFDRLLLEMPQSITDAHVQIVQQLYQSASLEEKLCVNFKHEHIERLLKDEHLRGLVDTIYSESRSMLIDYFDLSNLLPRLRTFVGTNDPDAAGDRRFALLAIEEAVKSVPGDGRPHPKVGAVVVKNGAVLSKAHRGENLKSHAEFIALEEKLSDDLIAGSTVYTTLEPCTTRKHPKIPCAKRLIDRKVARVVIGMLDPNPEIRGRGDQLLSDAGIEVQLFPRDLRAKVEEMNRSFIEAQRQRHVPSPQAEAAGRAETLASRAASDAAEDLRDAAWSLYALHAPQHLIAMAAKDVADEQSRIEARVETASKVLARSYDLPAELAEIARTEMANINVSMVSLRRASTGRGEAPIKIAATQVQDACERIRAAAKPYAYRKIN